MSMCIFLLSGLVTFSSSLNSRNWSGWEEKNNVISCSFSERKLIGRDWRSSPPVSEESPHWFVQWDACVWFSLAHSQLNLSSISTLHPVSRLLECCLLSLACILSFFFLLLLLFHFGLVCFTETPVNHSKIHCREVCYSDVGLISLVF